MASESTEVSTYFTKGVVRGHHIYKVLWTPLVGEVLPVDVEENNVHDPNAVAVRKTGVIVGHVPRVTSRTVWYFVRRGGAVWCEVTGSRKKGNGLEVPCTYTFSGPNKLVKKLEALLTQ